MAVTHRDLPKDIDPVGFLFGDVKLTVPESYFTPEMTVRLYARALEEVPVRWLHSQSDNVPHGLKSLPSLLRYMPGPYGTKWLIREADTEVIR